MSVKREKNTTESLKEYHFKKNNPTAATIYVTEPLLSRNKVSGIS